MNKQNPVIIFLVLMAAILGYFAFLFNSQKASEHKLRVQNEQLLSEKEIEL